MSDNRPNEQLVWHPIEQKMPMFWQPVLATLIPFNGNTKVCPPFVAALRLANVKDKAFIYDNTGGMNREDGGYVPVSGYRVTHWMPYPEPCRE